MKFYGREEELLALKREWALLSKGSRLAVLFGRRRVGKTRLIVEFCEKNALPYFYFSVKRQYSEKQLARAWCAELRREYGLAEADEPDRERLCDAVRLAMKLSKGRPAVFVIDECQELDFIAPGFWSGLQEAWDLGKDRSNLLLVMSGSILSAMRRIFGSSSEPLYGRADLLFELKPFKPSEIREIFLDRNPAGSPEDLLFLWCATGGVARYIEDLASSTPLTEESMASHVFSPSGAFLQADGEILLANEFRAESNVYFQVIQAVANGAARWSEVSSTVEGQLGPYIKRLETFGLIRRSYPLLAKPALRSVRYAVADEYLRFWLRFIATPRMQDLAERRDWKNMRRVFSADYAAYSGRSLENWFRELYRTSGDWIDVGGWWDRRGENELDIVAIDSLARKAEIAEVKRNPKKVSEAILAMKAKAFFDANPSAAGYDLALRSLSLEDMLSWG